FAEELTFGAERTADVSGVVLRECRPEGVDCLLARPTLEEPIAVPRVLVLDSPAGELDDPLGEVAIANLLGEQHPPGANFFCPQEQVVPEVVEKLVEPLLGRRRRPCWAGRLGSG